MLTVKKEERADKIYTTYEGSGFEFPASDNVLGIRESLQYNNIKDKYRATYSQFKEENFISKIRILAKQNKDKKFSLKYPYLAS